MITTPKKSKLLPCLGQMLANTYALLVLTHAAHWNVEGRAFFTLHAAFQAQYDELFESSDTIAEHIRQLGGKPVGGICAFAQESQIDESAEPTKGEEFAAQILDGRKQLLKCVLSVQEMATSEGDLETQDLTIRQALAHKKAIWMLSSFLK